MKSGKIAPISTRPSGWNTGRSSLSICAAAFALLLFSAGPALAADPGPIGMVSYASSPRAAPPLLFHDAEGGQHTLADYKGRYVLLHIWATWCAWCVKELPSLDALQGRLDPQKFLVLPISEDHAGSDVKAFFTSLKIGHLPVAIDPAERAPTAYRLSGLPSSILIDPAGRELGRVEGATDWGSPEAAGFLNTAMKP